MAMHKKPLCILFIYVIKYVDLISVIDIFSHILKNLSVEPIHTWNNSEKFILKCSAYPEINISVPVGNIVSTFYNMDK
jgi:hypothetical protein